MRNLNPNTIDERGNRYSRLLVIKASKRDAGGQIAWLCLCDCGRKTIVLGQNLRKGRTRSCGCLSAETTKERSMTHGFKSNGKSHYLYNTWSGIIQRCYNEKNSSFRNYGARGIVMLEKWRNNFEDFANWVQKNLGARPKNHTLDRIDNERGYFPGNLRWANRSIQNSNRRPRRSITEKENRLLELLQKYNVCNDKMFLKLIKGNTDV